MIVYVNDKSIHNIFVGLGYEIKWSHGDTFIPGRRADGGCCWLTPKSPRRRYAPSANPQTGDD